MLAKLLMLGLLLVAALAPGQTIIVDNAEPGFQVISGSWSTGTSTAGKYGPDYRFASCTINPTPTARCRFTPVLPQTGYYYVSVWYNTGSNRATNTPYTIHGDQGTSTVRVDQQSNGAQWFYIGQMHFAAGSTGSVSVGNDADNLVVMADAVQWVYYGSTPGPEPDDPVFPPGEEGPEVRGMWVSRFEWPRSDEAQTKARLDSIINALAGANFNSLFLQVRGAMETFYPSPYEPWAKETFNYTPQPYDPLAYAVQKSHAAGLKLHAYINTHVITQGTTPPNVPGGQPPHPFYDHGNPADPNNRDWVYHTSDGQAQQLGQGEENYNWVAPGVPGYQEWTRRQVVHVAQNYHVDGVHFDRIRFAGNGSYDPISLQRSAIGSATNPANLGFRNWQRDQITRLLNDIYGAVAEINYNRPAGKPFVQVSSAPFRGQSQQESVNQMVGQWTGIGAQDFFVPQVYTGDIDSFEATLNTNFPLANGRHVVAGISRNSTGNATTTLAEIAKARELGARGTVIFSYTAFGPSELQNFSTTAYQQKVTPPAMDWVTTPTDAIIVGNVRAPENAPILDAQLTRTGSGYVWLSGADGFYSMLKTPKSQPHNITVSKEGYAPAIVAVPALAAGEVRRVDITLQADSGVDDWMVY